MRQARDGTRPEVSVTVSPIRDAEGRIVGASKIARVVSAQRRSAAALRQMPPWRDTPVFIWTSMVLTDDEYNTLARSAQAVLAKGGGELAELFDTLRSWRPPTAQPAVTPPEGGRT